MVYVEKVFLGDNRSARPDNDCPRCNASSFSSAAMDGYSSSQILVTGRGLDPPCDDRSVVSVRLAEATREGRCCAGTEAEQARDYGGG